jgi:hypothetical protein
MNGSALLPPVGVEDLGSYTPADGERTVGDPTVSGDLIGDTTDVFAADVV